MFCNIGPRMLQQQQDWLDHFLLFLWVNFLARIIASADDHVWSIAAAAAPSNKSLRSIGFHSDQEKLNQRECDRNKWNSDIIVLPLFHSANVCRCKPSQAMLFRGIEWHYSKNNFVHFYWKSNVLLSARKGFKFIELFDLLMAVLTSVSKATL